MNILLKLKTKVIQKEKKISMEKTKQIADLLLTQHAEKKVFSNLNGQYQPVSTDEAYMAQHEFQKRSSRGPIGGFKIALASIVQQELCGINHPIAGGIFSSDIHYSPHQICLQQYHGLGLEFELAFKISKTVWSNELKKKGFNLLDHVDEIYPAFELIIDRDADYTDLSALTLIADNAWSGGVVLGNSIKNWQSLDFYELKSTLYWNNETPVEAKIIDANRYELTPGFIDLHTHSDISFILDPTPVPCLTTSSRPFVT